MGERPSGLAREGIRFHVEGSVCRITLERPHVHNALDDPAMATLTAAIAGLPDAVQVVVLAGAGASFCTGGERLPPERSGAAERAFRLRQWNDLCDSVRSIPAVTVARLRGHCVGGGALLALSCDLRVGDDTVSVRIPEARAGIPARALSLARLHSELGVPATRDLLLTGRRWCAEEAAAAGFLRVVPAGELEQAVEAIVRPLAIAPLERVFQDKADLSRPGPLADPSRAGRPRIGAQHG